MAYRLQDDIDAILQWMDNQNSHQPAEDWGCRESEAGSAITETIHVYVVREAELAEPADEQVRCSILAQALPFPAGLLV